jgi:autophagy-related protein 16
MRENAERKRLWFVDHCPFADGSYIAAGGADGVIYVWDAVTGSIAKTLSGGHKSAVVACSWGDNDQLASIEKEHRLILWE